MINSIAAEYRYETAASAISVTDDARRILQQVNEATARARQSAVLAAPKGTV